MNYEEWKSESSKLYNLIDIAEEKLNDFIKSLWEKHSLKPHQNGLIHDVVKNDLGYQEAKKNFNLSFQNYRKFNEKSPKKFMQKRALENRENKVKQAQLEVQ